MTDLSNQKYAQSDNYVHVFCLNVHILHFLLCHNTKML